MATITDLTANPKALVESLDADAIRARMKEIEAERVALEVLLRAACRREWRIGKPTAAKRKAVKA